MAVGSVSSLGIGSGLDLQSIIDQLREVDEEQALTPKQDEITELEEQLNEFTVVKNKLLTMKSSALNLSLSSTFLGRSVASSDETVFTAEVTESAAVGSSSVTINQLATKSSWLSTGVSDEDTIVYVPTIQETEKGVTDPAAASYITADDTLVITFGSGSTKQTITVDVTNGMSMDDVVTAINEDDENGNAAPPSLYVTAETFTEGTDTYLRIKSTAGGTGEDNRVMITTQLDDEDIVFAAPDKTISFQVGGDITTQRSTAGVSDKDAAGYITAADTLILSYDNGGATVSISVDVAFDDSLADVVQKINEDDENGGVGNPSQYVTAEALKIGDKYYLNIYSTAEGNIEDNEVLITQQFANNDITLQSPDLYSITVEADTTLSDLADLLNDDADNPGVTASVIDNGDPVNPYQLVLQSKNTGENYRIRYLTTDLPEMPSFAEGQGAGGPSVESLNAKITVEGIDYQRQSNTVSDVITGVTLTLLSADTATVTVGNNNESIKEMITSLVTAYNDAAQELNSKTGYDDETDSFGILSDTTLRDLVFDLRNLMTSTIYADSSGEITSLFDLGLEFDRDGIITIDSEVLDAAFESYADEIEYFFLGDEDREITGFGDIVNDRLRALTSTSGQIEAEKSYANDRIDELELDIESETERLDKKYEILIKQFIELDRFMSQMTALSSYLTSQFDSLNSLLSGSGNNNK